MNALIIDDSRAMRNLLRKIMEGFGYQTIEAVDGQDALLKAERCTIDLDVALIDWNMPVMNGLDFVKAIRSHDRLSSMKLVMVTTETEPERIAQALIHGADEFVMKPFTKEILREKLELVGVPMSRVPTHS